MSDDMFLSSRQRLKTTLIAVVMTVFMCIVIPNVFDMTTDEKLFVISVIALYQSFKSIGTLAEGGFL